MATSIGSMKEVAKVIPDLAMKNDSTPEAASEAATEEMNSTAEDTPFSAAHQGEQASSDAGARIAGNYELLENIMINMRRHDLIVSQYVSKAFSDVYARSLKLDKRWDLRIPWSGQTVYFVARPAGPLAMVRATRGGHEKHKELKLCVHGFSHMRSKDTFNTNWRPIPIVLPDSPVVSIYKHIESNLDLCGPNGNMRRDLQGLTTLGKLADILHACARRLPSTYKGGNFVPTCPEGHKVWKRSHQRHLAAIRV